MAIDPTTFEYRDSRWQDLYDYLRSKGYEVYSPGQKEGDCLSPYLVVKYSGSAKAQQISSRQDLYDIMLYVPKTQYSKLESLVQKVIADMKEIEPLFLPYDNQQDPSYFDDSVKAHFVTVVYMNYKKN